MNHTYHSSISTFPPLLFFCIGAAAAHLPLRASGVSPSLSPLPSLSALPWWLCLSLLFLSLLFLLLLLLFLLLLLLLLLLLFLGLRYESVRGTPGLHWTRVRTEPVEDKLPNNVDPVV